VASLKMGGVDYITKPMHGEEVLPRVRVHLRIRESTRALVERQRERLNQLRDAQRAILVLPEDVPQANFAVYYQPLDELGGDCYDVVPWASGNFAYFVAEITGHGPRAAYLTSALTRCCGNMPGPIFSPEDTMRGGGFGDVEDAECRPVFDGLLRPPQPAGALPLGHQRWPSSTDTGQSGVAQSVELDSAPLGIFGGAILQRTDLRVSRGDRFFL
jgi:phosphoserine phosphatase RsbU/P